MAYEWDPVKASSNLEKHAVDFADAALVLEDDHCFTIPDPHSESESRFAALGADPFGKLLVVVFTYRGEVIRITSARRATKRERRLYEAEQ